MGKARVLAALLLAITATVGIASAPVAAATPKFLTLPLASSRHMVIQQAWLWTGSGVVHLANGRTIVEKLHAGIDYVHGKLDRAATWQSFPVLAAAPGKACASMNGRSACGVSTNGNFVVIRHRAAGRTYYTFYGHLRTIDPAIPRGRFGRSVGRGQLIGQSGYSGDACCITHLHFELEDANHHPIDPYGLYKQRDAYPDPAGRNGRHAGKRSYWIMDTLPLPTPTSRPRPTPRPTPIAGTSAPSAVVDDVAGTGTVLAWSPDESRLAATAGDARGLDSTARLWDAVGAPVAQLVGHAAPVTSLSWAPDGSRLATGSHDGSVRLWSSDGFADASVPGVDPVFSIAWSPDGLQFAVGTIHLPTSAGGTDAGAGKITVLRADGSLVRVLPAGATDGTFLDVAWSPDGRWLAGGAIDYHAWSADGSQEETLRSGGPPARAMAWAPDGVSVVIGDQDGLLQQLAPDGSVLAAARMDGPIDSVAWSSDGTRLAVEHGSSVSIVSAEDLTSPLAKRAALAGVPPAWAASGGHLAIGTPAGIELVTSDGEDSTVLTGCAGSPVALAWSPSGGSIVAATAAGNLCWWQVP